MDYLIIYFGIGLLIITWLAVYSVLKQNKTGDAGIGEIVILFAIWVLVWPIVIFSTWYGGVLPSLTTRYKSPIPNLANSIESQERELKSLWDNPPLCGEYIFIRGVDESLMKTIPSVFIFKADEALSCIIDNLDDKIDYNNHRAGISRWLQHRDRSLSLTSKIPSVWHDNSSFASSAIKLGIGTCYCYECKMTYESKILTSPDEPYKAGWNFRSIYCPKLHLVQRTKEIHFSMSTTVS